MNDVRPPCLYLLWPQRPLDLAQPVLPAGYALRVYRHTDDQQIIDLLESDDEPMSEKAWHAYLNMLLPNGLFLIEDVENAAIVATACAVHNPNPGRYYFPSGGELGYLIVAPKHRRQGLGTAVCAAVVSRLISAGYESIRVCVQEHRLPAIGTYLRLGFEPFLHSREVEQRWRQVYSALNRPFRPEAWPRELPEGSRQSN